MANKKKKKSKGAAPVDTTHASIAPQEERPATSDEVYSAKFSEQVPEISAAAIAQLKMDVTTPNSGHDSWEGQEYIITPSKSEPKVLTVLDPSATDLFDQFRELDSTSQWATCYEPHGTFGERPWVIGTEDNAVNSSTIEYLSSDPARKSIFNNMKSITDKGSEAAVDCGKDKDQLPAPAEKAFKEQQLRIFRLETELEKCKRDLKAAKLEAVTAKHESAKMKKIVSDCSQDLRKTCTTLTTDIELAPQQLNKKGEDKGYLAFKKSAAKTQNSVRENQTDSADSLESFRSSGERIRAMAELIQTENAYLKRTRDSYKSAYADTAAQLETRSQEIHNLRDEAVHCHSRVRCEKAKVIESQENAKRVSEELKKVKNQLQDIEPLVKIGMAIRLRFLEQSKITLGPVPRDSLDIDILEEGNAAAHSANALADAALIRSYVGDAADWEEQFSKVYSRSTTDFFSDFGPVLQRSVELARTCDFLNDGQGSYESRKKVDNTLRKLYEVHKPLDREATPDDDRLLKKLEGLVCEIVNGRDRTNRRR